MARAALLGAGLVALIPLVAIPLLGVTEDSLGELPGSLLALLVLVAPPVLVLGALSPWAIRLRVRTVAAAGDVTGRLYALSTAGGLVGNFAAALALIPLVGTRWTFLICAALLAAVSAPVAWPPPGLPERRPRDAASRSRRRSWPPTRGRASRAGAVSIHAHPRDADGHETLDPAAHRRGACARCAPLRRRDLAVHRPVDHGRRRRRARRARSRAGPSGPTSSR